MKKIIQVVLLLALSALLAFSSKGKTLVAKELYQVYLDGEVIGHINDPDELNNYVVEKNKTIVSELGVQELKLPETLSVKKILTYKEEVSDLNDIYVSIFQKDDFTVEGFEFILTNDDKSNKIFVLNEEIFNEAVDLTIETFVGKELYQVYLEDKQTKLDGVGVYIDNIYLEDDITYKNKLISVTEKIYTDPYELSKFLLFGTLEEQETYEVKENDTIESICFSNKISTEEFLISNPSFRSENSLIYEGQKVTIGITNPQISVVIEEQRVEDQESNFSVDYIYDDTQYENYEEVKHEGVKGLDRVSRNIKTVNGTILFAEADSKESIIPPVSKVVVKGTRQSPSIGTSYSWTWPTSSGWTLTQNYEWRIHPINYYREFHNALDIANRYGAPIYASNNGVVVKSSYQSGYGNYIVINHNNGYYTLYGHNQRNLVSVGDVVPAGSVIAYMGSTGMSTGPHVHFELWKGMPHGGGYYISPWTVLR